MTYATESENIELAKSPELYCINAGFGQEVSYYTNYDQNVVFQGNEYLARAIQRSGFSMERTLKTVDVSISAPITTEFGAFIALNPAIRTDVTIVSAYLPTVDTNYRVIFKGVVMSVDVQDFVLTARCSSFNYMLQDKIPRLFFQTNCNHHIFDDFCGLAKNTYKKVKTVVSVTGAVVELDLSDLTNIYLKGGTLVFGNDQRLITNQSGNNLTLLVPMPQVHAGDLVTLYPGCSGAAGACQAYNNLEDGFLGFPTIPTRNPILWGFR
jgi:hypothetical protein